MATSTTNSKQKSYYWVASTVVLFISVNVYMLFPCICGHLSTKALPALIFTAAASWFVFYKDKHASEVQRTVEALCVICTTLLLLKNIADVLWLGHSPILSP